MLVDRYGRQITYLRISVTDRCNLRCVYCMPSEGVTWQAHDTILRYEEIAEIVRVAAAHGVRKIRLTGGEPLVRLHLDRLVAMLAAIPGIDDISLTTNGLLLDRLAEPLAAAGLTRVNVSLDTLDPGKFARLTRGGSFERTWQGLLAAECAGLAPLKLNTVAVRGLNDDEILSIARLSLEHPWQIRFIELMPVMNQTSWGEGYLPPEQAYLPVQELMDLLASLDLQPVETRVGNGPARDYRSPGAPGTVGFITPLGDMFCERCNRLRLTADGVLKPCLLSDQEIPLLPALRAGEDILPYLQRAVDAKPMSHELGDQHYPTQRCMQQVGG